MTSGTGIRGSFCIPVMAGGTVCGDGCMCAGEGVESSVVEGRGSPCLLIVAGGTISRKVKLGVAWFTSLLIIRSVASCASVWGVVVVALVAGGAIISDSGMCTLQDIVIIMYVKRSGRPSRRCSGMAGCAVMGEIQCRMVGVGRFLEIR